VSSLLGTRWLDRHPCRIPTCHSWIHETVQFDPVRIDDQVLVPKYSPDGKLLVCWFDDDPQIQRLSRREYPPTSWRRHLFHDCLDTLHRNCNLVISIVQLFVVTMIRRKSAINSSALQLGLSGIEDLRIGLCKPAFSGVRIH